MRVIAILLLMFSATINALIFDLVANSDLVGQVTTTTTVKGETLCDLGRYFDIGKYDLLEANPSLKTNPQKSGLKVILPTRFILPSGLREGIVINLAEMRLYYFLPNKRQVATFPIGIGRKGWCTPLGEMTIIQKKPNPTWTPTVSMRKAAKAKGITLPKKVAAGPNNPMGAYALRLSEPNYLIHGTNRENSVGIRSSSGCIRMWPEDIATLFHLVEVGTKVRIIHEAVKIGIDGDKVFLESHPPLTDNYYGKADQQVLLAETVASLKQYQPLSLNLVASALKEFAGYPKLILG